MNARGSAGRSLRYGEGWYAEEQDETGPFRWMGRHARCHASGLEAGQAAWLRITGGRWRASAVSSSLSVRVNGEIVGEAPVDPDVAHRVFPIEIVPALEVALTVDRTFAVPGDTRDLGMMVRGVEICLQDEAEAVIDAEGWYEWERHEYFPFRWMRREARLIVPQRVWRRGPFVSLPIFTPGGTGSQVLRVQANTGIVRTLALRHGWHVYAVDLAGDRSTPAGADASLELSFALDRLDAGSWRGADPRELGVAIGDLEFHDDRLDSEFVRRFHAESDIDDPESRRAGDPAAPAPPGVDAARLLPCEGNGWYDLEIDEQGPFRWMKREGRLRLSQGSRRGRFCTVPVFSAFRNLSQELTILADGRELAVFPLGRAWNRYTLALPDASGDLVLILRLNKLMPPGSHPTDPRELGVRVGPLALHDDPERHAREQLVQGNRASRQRELLRGATVLTSFPSTLGIDLYGRCNIKPPCVYCLWDRMKPLEGANVDEVVDDRTLESYGPFFRNAETLVNCSFGEPLLHPRLEQILDFLERQGKAVELSTNGQAFSARTVRALAGRPVQLYVSLDAATADTYARLRNDHWRRVVEGLLFLRDARRRSGGRPVLHMVFIPMRANVHDLEAYFKLCRLVEADTLVLRPLLRLENPDIVVARGNYVFDYERELLGREELEALFTDAGRLGERYDVNVRSQFDFGKLDEPSVRARWRERQ